MAWTDEKRQLVIEQYNEIMQNEYNNDEDRAAASVEVVKELAEIHGETPNGVRLILSKAGAYIKQTKAKKATESKSGGTRISKADAIQILTAMIESVGAEVDEEILSKLTGKAAAYLTTVLQKAVG